MSLPTIAFEGTLTADPDLRFTKAGLPVCTMRVAVNDRKQDEKGNWVNGDAVFFTVTSWRKMAENAAESLRKGDLVVVNGRMKVTTWEDKDGKERTTQEVDALSLGLSLRFVSVEAGSKPKEATWEDLTSVPF